MIYDPNKYAYTEIKNYLQPYGYEEMYNSLYNGKNNCSVRVSDKGFYSIHHIDLATGKQVAYFTQSLIIYECIGYLFVNGYL